MSKLWKTLGPVAIFGLVVAVGLHIPKTLKDIETLQKPSSNVSEETSQAMNSLFQKNGESTLSLEYVNKTLDNLPNVTVTDKSPMHKAEEGWVLAESWDSADSAMYTLKSKGVVDLLLLLDSENLFVRQLKIDEANSSMQLIIQLKGGAQ